mmetsp:Transcript_34480/g.72592  ORF Transcript_34480/g.72592 Transcript_34480/m.72592 type:complete len:280 (-) Transcript_34480:277-1116(-)
MSAWPYQNRLPILSSTCILVSAIRRRRMSSVPTWSPRAWTARPRIAALCFCCPLALHRVQLRHVEALAAIGSRLRRRAHALIRRPLANVLLHVPLCGAAECRGQVAQVDEARQLVDFSKGDRVVLLGAHERPEELECEAHRSWKPYKQGLATAAPWIVLAIHLNRRLTSLVWHPKCRVANVHNRRAFEWPSQSYALGHGPFLSVCHLSNDFINGAVRYAIGIDEWIALFVCETFQADRISLRAVERSNFSNGDLPQTFSPRVFCSELLDRPIFVSLGLL